MSPAHAAGPPVPVADVRSLSVRTRSGRRLLDGIDLRVEPGERVGLIGESGSGKSLTALAIMGLLPENLHAGGSVQVCGTEIAGASDARIRRLRGSRMSMVFQEPMTALNPTMRVGRQITEALRAHRSLDRASARARAVELLTEMRLPDPAAAARAYPHQLSGGQRQRVVLAIALANDPDLLICDEPTTALDVTVQAVVLDRIVEGARARGSSVLFISHDLAVVATVCDRILVMADGRITESGTTREILTRPRHPRTIELVKASSRGGPRRAGRSAPDASPRARPGDAPGNAPAIASGDAPATAPGGTPVTAPGDARPGTPAEDSVIEVRSLTREFGRRRSWAGRPGRLVRALDQVSFTVPAGQRLGIVGESGCGKSTLLRLIAGLDAPTSGEVRIGGRLISGQPESRLGFLRDRLQMVFQDPHGSLDPRMRIWQIVAEPLRARHREAHRERVWELLAAVGLDPEVATRYPHEFSGGQRQRIAIARALAPGPDILLADEAVSALDVTVRAQILDLLTDLAAEHGFTLVFVSHDLFVVEDMCDRILVMQAGRIVEDGQATKIVQHPREPYTRSLLGSLPTVSGALAGVRAADLVAASAR